MSENQETKIEKEDVLKEWAPLEETIVDEGEQESQEIRADEIKGSDTKTEIESESESKSLDDEQEEGEWYILQVFTGKELLVQNRVEGIIEEQSWDKIVFRVLVPEEEIIEIKNNKRIEKKTKIYPGYIFIKMIYSEEICYEFARIQGASKFVGTRVSPTPVQDEEMLKVLRKIGDKTKKMDVDFEVDEVVKVISGPFRGYSGNISEINIDRGKLKALISIFGRETPVELEFDQVEKSVR